MTTNTKRTEKEIAMYAREIAKVVIGLRGEGTPSALAAAARITLEAQERCQAMREGRA